MWFIHSTVTSASLTLSIFPGYGLSYLTTQNLIRYPSPPIDNIWVMVIVWRLRGNIIRTALCWIVWHNVHSLQHTYMSSSYRSNRLALSHWNPYAVHRCGCLELYYCNMVEWLWWDSSLISTNNWFPSVVWHCWFSHLACKNPPRNDYYVSSGTLNPRHSLTLPIRSAAVTLSTGVKVPILTNSESPTSASLQWRCFTCARNQRKFKCFHLKTSTQTIRDRTKATDVSMGQWSMHTVDARS